MDEATPARRDLEMSIYGHCDCRNIEVIWHTVDYSVAPRACQCDYCLARDAAYVSKAGTRVEVSIHNSKLHRIVRQGSESAEFHECGNCGRIVLATVELDGELYGALNANQLKNPRGFASPVKTDWSGQSAAQKLERWRQNWCHPVRICG